MPKPIPLLTGPEDEVTAISVGDLNRLIRAVNAAQAPASPTAATSLLRDIERLRAQVEEAAPLLDYSRASALSSYLRAVTDVVHDRMDATYPHPQQAEPDPATPD